jgi:hypothetical protein
MTSNAEHQAVQNTTRFAACTRWQALALFILTIAAIGWCVRVALTEEIIPSSSAQSASQAPASPPSREAQGDAEFYRAIVRRVHAGEGYYDAVASELQQRGYPPHSMFNWRPPFYAWIFGLPPSPIWGQIILVLGVLVTMSLAYQAMASAGGVGKAAGCTVLLIGPFAWCGFPDVCLFAELWAGMFITLSVAAFVLDRWRVAVVAGLLALFFRELALPYCLIAAGLAWWHKRRAETAWWLAGLVLYGVFLTFHGLEAGRRINSTDVVHASSWIQFGGTPFVLLTTQINYFLILAPSWVAALYLPLALLGFMACPAATAGRAGLTAAAFVAAFTVIGIKPHNAYWGLMYAPLLPLGIVWAPAALRDLWSAASSPRRRESHQLRATPWEEASLGLVTRSASAETTLELRSPPIEGC